MTLSAQPMLAVRDVPASRDWYCAVLGAAGGHGGTEYEQIVVDDRMVLQLHDLATDHHHGPIGDPALPLGNGVAVWFAVDDLPSAVERSRSHGATVQTDLHHNPNADHDEIWLRDPDGYLVVLASY